AWGVSEAADAGAAVRAVDDRPGAADLDKGGDARGCRPDDDGDGAAVGLPVRLRVPAGFDAAGVRVGRPVPANDVVDRRLAWGDPAWGRLAGPVAPCGGPVGDGDSVPGFQLVQGAEATLVTGQFAGFGFWLTPPPGGEGEETSGPGVREAAQNSM